MKPICLESLEADKTLESEHWRHFLVSETRESDIGSQFHAPPSPRRVQTTPEIDPARLCQAASSPQWIPPKPGSVTVNLAVQEGAHAFFEHTTQARDLTLEDPGHTQRLDQVVRRTDTDALDVEPIAFFSRDFASILMQSRMQK